MNYVELVCVCCKGKWRGRIELPDGRDLKRAVRYLSPWEVLVICGRCNTGDCTRAGIGRRLPEEGCNEGRRDAA